jgi:hypothetical protein
LRLICEEFATLLANAERQIPTGLFDEINCTISCDASFILASWRRDWEVPFLIFTVLTAGRSGDNDIPFLRKIHLIVIQIFTFFVDSELNVYETGTDAILFSQR